MKPAQLWKMLAVTLVLAPGNDREAEADSIAFRKGRSSDQVQLRVSPTMPATTDTIAFTDPFDRSTYGNNCQAAAINGWPQIDVDENEHLVTISFDDTNKPQVCTLQFDPVSGLAGMFGPLSAGDWVLNSALGEQLPFSVMGATALLPGDADQDLDFDQFDIIQVQQAGKYLTGQDATWGEGDWNGAPAGFPGNPPAGNGRFDQSDIIAALNSGIYFTGTYAASTTEKPDHQDFELNHAEVNLAGSLAAVEDMGSVATVQIPEPTMFALLVAGLGGIATVFRIRF